MGFIQDFKDFAFKGNLIDMAVGIVMGGAVAAIVKSFLTNIVTPIIAKVAKVPDMSSLNSTIGMAEVKNEAGELVEAPIILNWGTFVQNTMDFVILAFVIFIALKVAARWMKKAEEDAPPAEDIVLLREIRDALAKN